MRILVADRDVRVRSALNLLLKQEPGETLLAESGDLDSLAVQIREFRPDLLLLDWDLPGRAAAALLVALHGQNLEVKVIVLSGQLEAERAARAVGADGFVYKGDPPEQLLITCRQIMATGGKGQAP